MNKRKLMILIVVLLSSLSLFAQQHVSAFLKYPAQTKQIQRKAIVFDQQSRKYRTLLREMSLQPFNFSGNSVAQTYGCGGGCSGLLVYNGKTGRGLLLKDQFSDCFSEKYGFRQNDIFFEKNSRLIIAIGTRKGEPNQCEEVHYLIEKYQFKEVETRWFYPK